MTTFEAFCNVATSCEGYLIERLFLSRVEDTDALDIALRWGPEKPDITLSFQNIYYLETGRLPEAAAGPLDQVTTTLLEPRDEPWPEGLEPDLVRSAELPALIWFRASGPVQLSVVSAIATAYVETR
jgi:hypothetical protein